MINYTPVVHNFTLYEGDDVPVEFTSEMGDISGFQVEFQARLNGNSRFAIITIQGNVVDGTTGKYVINFTSEDTLGKSDVTALPYDIKFIDLQGRTYTDRYGSLTITPRNTGMPPVVKRDGIDIALDGQIEVYQADTINFDSEFFALDLTDPMETNSVEARVSGKRSVEVDGKIGTSITTGVGFDTTETDGVINITRNTSISPWEAVPATSPLTINHVDQLGKEYFIPASSTDASIAILMGGFPDGAQVKLNLTGVSNTTKPLNVATQSDGSWVVVTPTVFTYRGEKWIVEESSQTIHLANATSFDDNQGVFSVVHGIRTDDDSNLVSHVDENGVMVLSNTPQDMSEYQRLDAEEINYPSILKNGSQVLTIDDILEGGDINLDGYQRLDAESINYPAVEITPTETGKALRVKNLDGTDLLSAFTSDSTSNVEYLKTLSDYADSSNPFEIVNMAYANTHFVKQGGGYIAGDTVIMQKNAYVLGSEFMTNVDYFTWNGGTILGSGDLTFNPDTGEWEGDLYDIGEVHTDSIELYKVHARDLTVDHITVNNDPYVRKHTNAELNKMYVAYQGKYGDNRVHHPVSLYQDVNGWTQLEFTGNMLFKTKSKDSGSVGDKVLEVKANEVVIHKKGKLLQDTTYDGDTTKPTNLVTREALEEALTREWFFVANGTLVTDGSRPSGGAGTEGELNIWHNVTSDSTTDPANEFKVLFEGAYSKVNNFTRPLRYKLSQQGGTRNQYWEVSTNGWETNSNVWHLSAIKVSGDNLVVGIDTEVYASFHWLGEDSEDSDFSYHGQGIGVPDYVWMPNGTNPVQSQPVGLYGNSSNDASSRGIVTLSQADGYSEFEVIINCLAKPTRDFRVQIDNLGKYSDKRIRTSEIWSCRVKVDWVDSINSSFFWTRLDNAADSFEAVDVSGFDSQEVNTKPLKKTFENKDLISIPIELEEGFQVIVTKVLCKVNGKLKNMPYEFEHSNGMLRVHLSEVCSGIIVAELIK